MTDPLSVSASISGLVTLADIVFRRTYKYAKAVKKAPKEISALSAEISSLYGILSSLQLVSRQLEDETFDTSTRIHHVQSCFETLEHVRSILDKDDTSSLHDQRLETLKRKLRWPFTSSEVKDLIAEIERHKATLGLALNVDCMSGLIQALSRQDEIRSTVEGIRTEFKERHEAETRIAIDKERKEILKSFAKVDPHSNHDMSRKLRSPGTGLWLTEGQEFKQWMETKNAKLWYYGIPGAGKTVLASSVIEEAFRISNPSIAVAFFYCDYKDPATQDLSYILASLAQQFAKQDEDSFTKLRDFHKAHNSEHQSNVKYDSDALSTLVKEVTLGFDSALIIVDGLDECGRNASVVVDALVALNEIDDSTIKTIFLSRDEIDIRERLEGYTMVSIAARSSDLKLYVGAEIDIRMRKKRLRLKDQSLKEHILERLVGGAEGMFRWVTCQMDYLCELPNDAARRVALGSLPPDLNSTYERILSRVNQGNAETQRLVRRALRWIANDARLTIEALCEAVSIDLGSTRLDREAIPDEYEILHRCSSLVRKSENGEKLELAHFTVKEFLQQIDPRRDLAIAAYRYDPGNDKPILAKVCLTFLMFGDFDQGDPTSKQVAELRLKGYHFREHAVDTWYEYTGREGLFSDTELSALLQKMFDPSKTNALISWAQDLIFYWGGKKSSSEKDVIYSGLAEATPLHYAAVLGLAEVCDWLIGSGCDVNRNTKFGTPLHCALFEQTVFFGRFYDTLSLRIHNRLEIVELLLEAGADPNCYYHLNTVKISPLYFALVETDLDYAAKLLARGAIMDSDCLSKLENAEDTRGFSAEQVSELLGLVTEDNLQQDDNTRLIELALRLEASNATRLMQLSSNLPSQSLQYEQYLRIAAEYGQVELVVSLLEAQKLDVNAADGDTGLTALHHAAKTNQLRVAQVLLDRGADLSQVDNQRRTALHHCIVSGEAACLRFFLQTNPVMSDRDLEGMTIWHLAAQEGNLEALSLLSTAQNKSASFVGLKANNGATAFLYASKNGNVEAMRLLLGAGSDLNDTDADGRTSLHYAVISGSLEAVKFLANKAGFPDVVTHDGSTALHYAITGSSKNLAGILRILMENGVDPRNPRNDGCTPLQILVNMIKDESNKHGDDVLDWMFAAGRTLLERMLESSRSASDLRLGSELIYLACSYPFPRAHEVVLALLGYSLDPNVAFTNGTTALMAAAQRGDATILNTLLLHGADPSIGASDLTVLHCACFNNHKNILIRLRETEVDWNSVTTAEIEKSQHTKVTALHIAAGSKDDSVLEYLLSENLMSNIDARTERGETSLSVSVWAENPRNVSLLLSKGADTTIVDEYGRSAIHWAAEQGSEEVIAEFIQYGSDLGLPDSCGLTPELVARKHGHETLAKTIMDYVSEKDKDDESNALTHSQTSSQLNRRSEALKVAIDIGDLELCTRLVESGMDLGAEIEGCLGCTPLLYSLHREQYAISEYLVAQGCSIKGSTCAKWGTRGFTALHYAAASGDVKLLRLLLENSASEVFLNRDPIHPIHLAIIRNNAECVKIILEHVSQGKVRNHSDQLGTSREALGRIINVQVRDYNSGWQWYGKDFPRELRTARPLQIAASVGNLQIGSMLLAHGASVNSVDGQHATPLHSAAYHGRIAMVKLLLEAGANLHALDRSLQSPAMTAAQQGHVNCVRVLLEAGADIKLRNTYGETALHLATRSGATDLFIFLMSKLSEYELATEDIWGRSILYYAMRESLAFPMSFLLSLAPPAAAYMSDNWNILNAAIHNRSSIDVNLLLRRIPAYLLPRLLNQREPWRGTPLHIAAIDEKFDIMTLLLDTGAQLEIEACEHGTALMGACATGRLASVKFLVAKGARTSYMQDGKVYSALLAAKYHAEVRRWLLVGRFVEGPRLLTFKEVEEEK